MDNKKYPKKIWYTPGELSKGLSTQLDRLMILSQVWKKLVGNKEKFWVLKAAKGGTLYVEANLSVAKNELIAKRSQLVKELNKYFDVPWIEKIDVQ